MKKIFIIFALMLIFLPLVFSTNSLYSTIWVNATSDQTKLLILNLSANQTVLQKNFDGLEIRDITSSKDGFIILTATNVNPRQVLTLDANLSIVKNFTFTVNSTLDVASCYRVNSTLYFCSGIYQSATGSMPIIEVDGNGNILNTKNVSQITNIGIDAGSPKFKLKMWDFINATGKRYLLLGYDTGGIQQDGFSTQWHYLSLGENDTVYRLYDFDNGSEWIPYYNKTLGAVTSVETRSFGFLDTLNNKVYIGGAGIPQVKDSFLGSNIVVWNINSTLQNTSLVKNVSAPADYNLVSRDIFSLIIMNYAGSIQEDTTQTGLSYVSKMDFTGLSAFSVGAFLGIVEWTNTTASLVTLGVIFSASESVPACNLNTPVNNVLCSIGNTSCSTTNIGTQTTTVTNVSTVANTGGSYRRSFVPDQQSPITLINKNPEGFRMSSVSPTGQAQVFNVYYAYNFPTNLNVVNKDTIKYDADFSNFGEPSSDLFVNCTGLIFGNNVEHFRIAIWSGYNKTHYKQMNISCQGTGNNTQTYSSVTFVDNSSVVDAIRGMRTTNVNLFGDNIDAISKNTLVPNSTIPLLFVPDSNIAMRNDMWVFSVNSSETVGCGFLCTRNLNLNDFAGSLFNERTKLSYTFNKTSASSCSVGNLTDGTYNFTCVAPSPFIFSKTRNNTLIDNITVQNQSATIPLSLERIRPLALAITVRDSATTRNPIINAVCSSPFSTNTTNSDGLCILPNIPPNSLITVSISPNNPNFKAVNTTFATGDYYNSQLRGDLTLPNKCENFDGQYKYFVNFDQLGIKKNIRFVVYDQNFDPTGIQNTIKDLQDNRRIFQDWFLKDYGFFDENYQSIKDQVAQATVKGATVVIDNRTDLTCITGSDGSCVIPFSVDFVTHNISSFKYPEYEPYSEQLPLSTYTGFIVFLQRNNSWWSDPNNAQQGLARGDFTSGFINFFISPITIGIFLSLGLSIAGTKYSGGNFLVGGFTFLGTFLALGVFGLFPLWMILIFVLLASGLMAFFFKQTFIGGG